MCTAATYKTKDFYMGRTLDYEFSYGEQITITPRNYEFDFRFAGKIKSHYALIGMAFVAEGYPLYYDAVNEKGLGMAGLNFVGNAAYEEALPEDETEVSQVAQFEFDASGTTDVKFDRTVNTQDILLWVPLDSLPGNQLYIESIQVF